MKFRKYKLEDVCNIQIGKTPRREVKEYWGKGYSWVSISDMKSRIITTTKEEITESAIKECGCKLIPQGTILMSFKLSIGKLAFAGKDLYTNEAIVGLEIKDKKVLHPEYLFYVLKNIPLIGSNNAAMGATLNKESMKILQLPIPEKLSDQLHIANLLSKAENLISQRKQSIVLLDEFLKSTFLDMFYTNLETESWNEVKFEELAEKKKASMRSGPFGSSLLHGEFTEIGDVKVLGIDNVVSNRFTWKRSRCISQEKYQELKRYRVYPNDVLISIMATLGRTAVVPNDIPICINSKHLAAITLDKKIANPFFVAYAFHTHPLIVSQMSNNVKGAIMDGLNLTIIRRIKLKVPPIELQNRFGKIFEKTEILKAHYLCSLQELENLYGSLSQRAFRGDLTANLQTLNI